jgi:uncharacterized protein (UPF0276 family)
MVSRGPGGGRGPRGTGIGLRAPHVAEILASRPPLPWLEVHPENYLGGGPAVGLLEQIRRDYRVSLHAVGLSLGTAGDLDGRHLARLRELVSRVEPCLVSEHLSWSGIDGMYLNHLLPLPYTEETLRLFSAHVERVQETLGRQILIENPSSYLGFHHSSIPEPEFLAELVRVAGCGLLCDVNNIFVTASNLGLDPFEYLGTLPAAAVREIHLAGHSRNEADGHTILIDDHGSPVADPVWDLYARALRRFGPVPTLIEWDTDLPPLAALLQEAGRADGIMSAVVNDDVHSSAA